MDIDFTGIGIFSVMTIIVILAIIAYGNSNTRAEMKRIYRSYCFPQPIFHAFHNMQELKTEVYKKTQKFFEENMLQPPSDLNTPYFLSMGLKYVELAQKEKHLFHLLCMSDSGTKLESLYDLAKHIPLPIAPEEIKRLLTEACAGFKLYHQADMKLEENHESR